MNEYKQKQISEIAQVLKDYTKEKKISASHAILDDYAELIYNEGYRKQEWIGVAEKIPELQKVVLAWATDGDESGVYRARVTSFETEDGETLYGWVCEGFEGADVRVTHWIPISEVMKMKGGAE